MTTEKSNPLLIDKAEAARLTSISPRTVDRFVSCGKFPPPLRVGGRRLWNRQALIEWVNGGCKPLEDRP